MATNYSIPTNRKIRGRNGVLLANSWDNVTGGANAISEDTGNHLDYALFKGIPELGTGGYFWTGSAYDGSLDPQNCSGWTSTSGSNAGEVGRATYNNRKFISLGHSWCNGFQKLLCACY